MPGVIRDPLRAKVRYDASTRPDAQAWQTLDEDERMELVREYHRDIGEELPEEQQNVLHAVAHVIVETQLALEVSPVPDTMARLIREGLGRHDAVHAIGAVLMGALYEDWSAHATNINDQYAKRLNKLTARRWLKGKV